jgi:hypothetical protein
LLNNEKFFFGDLSKHLVEKNWAIQEKVHDGIQGMLYIDYGFRTSIAMQITVVGSRFRMPGEAIIWRKNTKKDEETKTDSRGIEIITSHGKLHHTKIFIVERSHGNASNAWNEHLLKLPIEISTPLIFSTSSIFEHELFQTIADNAIQNPDINRMSRLTRSSVAIPVFESQYLICEYVETLKGVDSRKPIDPDKDYDMSINSRKNSSELLIDFKNELLPLLSRSYLMQSYTSGEQPILNRLLKYLKRFTIRDSIQHMFLELNSLIGSTFPCRIQKTEIDEKTEWTLVAEISKGMKLVLVCFCDDCDISLKEGGRTPLKLQFLSSLQEAMMHSFKEALLKFLYEECVIFFGAENLLKFENGAIQVRQALN